MATVTHRVTVASTTNAASYTSGSFTPAAGDLLVCFAAVTGQTATDWAVSDSQSLTWDKIARQTKNSSADIMEVWVSRATTAASSMTVTYSHASGNASGCVMFVASVSSMSRVGAVAVRQSSGQSNQAAGTPAPAFSSSCLTGNPTLGMIFNATNPATMTPPGSWTERADTGYSTPTTGGEYVSRDSGFTGTTVTWGSSSASAYGDIIIELDTSAAPSAPAVPTLVQHVHSPTAKGSTITGGGSYNVNFMQTTGSSNAIIVSATWDTTNSPTITVTDDGSNSYSTGIIFNDVAHGQAAAIWYAVNTSPATVVHWSPSTNASFVQVSISEFRNVATANAIDGTSGNNSSSATTITAGNINTTNNGDLIYQMVERYSSNVSQTFTKGASFTWLMPDQYWGIATQYQVQSSFGSINPTLTESGTSGWASVAIALKPASAGTSDSGIRARRLLHFNTEDETSGTVTTSFAAPQGNTIVVAQSAGGTYRISSISDGTNTYTELGHTTISPDSASIFYAKNITSSSATLTLTFTMTGSDPGGNGATFFIYELDGADTTNPVDTTFGTSGFASANGTQDQITGSGPVDTFTTAAAANDFIIVVGSMASDTATGWNSPTWLLQIPTTFTGEGNPTLVDENNPAGAGLNGSDTASRTYTFTHDTINHPGVGTWVVVGGAFKAAGSGGPTTDQLAPAWYADADGQLHNINYQLRVATGFESFAQPLINGAPVIPTIAWDELEWQKFVGATRWPWPPEDEQRHLFIPPAVTLGWDDWDWSKSFDVRVVVDQDERRIQLPPIPTLAWDEVDYQRFLGVRSYDHPPLDEEPQLLPVVPVVITPVPQADELWSVRTSAYWNFVKEIEDFWNPTLVSSINLFDDFEPDYSNIVSRHAAYKLLFNLTDEEPQIFPVPFQIGFLNAQFDDYDWNKRFDTRYSLQSIEEEPGNRPIILLRIQSDEPWGSGYFALQYNPQTTEEDFSLWANFPPPAAPTFDKTSNYEWQMRRDIRLSIGTTEEFMPAQLLIPTLAWDEVDWEKFFNPNYYGVQPLPFEDQTYGWFLNPPIPPPPANCPLPPTGADADTVMSNFGGTKPILALFCRICNSGKPLVVRADYAIWCQDCCAFVSKADTYMGTIRAPGQFRSIF